jgi:prepilin-type N-terminal cleavage/methylation domain-containing protein
MNKSFTLIEILVVIVVIGILSAFILVGMSSISSKANIAKGQAFSNSLRNSLLINLVSEWKFDGPSTTGVAVANDVKDSWGSNNGVLASGFEPTVKVGCECVSGHCLSFDGSTDYINCGTGANLNVGPQITITAWIKPSNELPNTWYFITGKSSFWGINEYGLQINNKRVGFFVDTIQASNPEILLMNNWYFLAGYYNGTSLVTYVNGIASSPINHSGSTLSNAFKFTIGADNEYGYVFPGLIDEVSVYDKAISISQIQESYFIGINKLFKNNSIVLEEFNQRIAELKSSLANN